MWLWWKCLSVEPTMFLYMLAFMITTVYEQDFFIQRACLVNHKLSPTICANLSFYPNYQTAVQSTTSMFFTYEDVLAQLFPVILAIFVGGWSDKYGRKWPLVIALCGKLYYSLTIALNAAFDWHLEYVLLISTMPTSLTGSDIIIFSSCFAYISDITNTYNRTLRISILDASFLCAMPLGIYIGRYLFVNVIGKSYCKLFLINSFFMMLSILYTLIKVKNNTSPYRISSVHLTKWQKFLTLFDIQALVVTFQLLRNSNFRRNPNIVCDTLDVQRQGINLKHISSNFISLSPQPPPPPPPPLPPALPLPSSSSSSSTSPALSTNSTVYKTPQNEIDCSISTSEQKTIDSQFEEIFGKLNETMKELEEMTSTPIKRKKCECLQCKSCEDGLLSLLPSSSSQLSLEPPKRPIFIEETKRPDRPTFSPEDNVTQHIIPTIITSTHYEESNTEELSRPRYVILLIILSMFFYAFSREERQSLHLYTRKTFRWTAEQYSYFSFFRYLTIAGTLLIILPSLSRILRASDFFVAFLGSGLQIAAHAIFYYTTNSYIFLQAGILSGMGVLVAPVIRSIASKLILSTHRGLLFGLLSICENASPLISTFVYSYTYRQHSNGIFLVSIATHIAVVLLLLIIYIINGYRDAASSNFNLQNIINSNCASPNIYSTPRKNIEMNELEPLTPRKSSVVSLVAQLKATKAGRRGATTNTNTNTTTTNTNLETKSLCQKHLENIQVY